MKVSKLPRNILGLALLFALLPLAAAQQSWQGAGSTGGTGSAAPRNVPRPPVIVPPADARTLPQQPGQPAFFFGNVMQEDGTSPPPGAVIELDCGGMVTRQAEVSLNGRFGFQLGDARGLSRILPDASEGIQSSFNRELIGEAPETRFPVRPQTALSTSRLAGCDLRAQLNGYRSSILRLDGGALAGFNEVGTIVLYPIERTRGTAISATSLLAPKAAKKSMEQARKALQKKEFDECEGLLKSAIKLYPQYGEAWLELGRLYQKQRRNEDARNAYRKAMEADKLNVRPYVQLAWLASAEQKWQEAADLTEKALTMDPMASADGYYLNALANFNLNNLAVAEKRARQEQRLDPGNRFPQVFLILAGIFARRDDTTGSIREMRNYLKLAPNAPDAGRIRSRLQMLSAAN